jgi:hypothetical protein
MSLYENVLKTIKSIKAIEPDAVAITLYSELKNIIRDQGVYFRAHDVQAVRVLIDPDYIIIEFYLQSIEVWIKIRKDRDYADVSIYPLNWCQCG